jgi:hypothetical protein
MIGTFLEVDPAPEHGMLDFPSEGSEDFRAAIHACMRLQGTSNGVRVLLLSVLGDTPTDCLGLEMATTNTFRPPRSEENSSSNHS